MELGGYYALLYFAFKLLLEKILKYPFRFVTLTAEDVSLVILCWLIQHSFIPGYSRVHNIIFFSLLLAHRAGEKYLGKEADGSSYPLT